MTKPLAVSLAQRFASMAALLSVAAMLAIGGASWWLINQQNAASMRSLLKMDANLRVANFSESLRAIDARMSELAGNNLIANALFDNADKERLLIPYLRDIQRVQNIPVDILFTDFRGGEIASNGNAGVTFKEPELNWLKEKLTAGQPASRVQSGEKGEELIAVEFIVLSNTKAVEGALLYKVRLDALGGRSGARLVHGEESKQLLQSQAATAVATDLPPIYKNIGFAVFAKPELTATPFDWPLLGGFLVLSSGIVVMVMLLGQYFGRGLTSDLLRLQAFARDVSENGFSEVRAETGKSLEASSLAQSINLMLDHLKYEHDKLGASEERFRSLFEYSEVGMNVRDADSKYLEVNPAFVEMTGYSKEELLRISFREITHPEDVEPSLANVKTLLKGARDHFQMEKRFIRKDGSTLWTDVTVSSVRDDAKKLISFIGVTQDITGRKLVEAELGEQTRRLSELIWASDVGTWEWNAQTGGIVSNQRWADILGYSLDELSPISFDTWLKLSHPDDALRMDELLTQYLNRESETYIWEARMRHKNGDWIWISTRGRLVESTADGKPLRMSGYHREITERKRAEAELLQQKQRLSEVIWGTNVGTWEWNVQTGETLFNQRWAEIVGYTLDELAPISIDTWSRLVHPDDAIRSGELLTQCFNRESDTYTCEARMRHKNGEWVWVWDRGRVVEWTVDGKPLRMSGTHQEITERKRAETELLESHEKLRLSASAADLYDWEWDVPRDTLSWGRDPLHLLGQPDGGTGKYPDFRELVHPEDRERYLAAGRHAIRTDEPYSIEFRILDRDGAVRWIFARGKCIFDSAGTPVRMIGVSQNITERKRAEAEISRFKNVLDNTLDMIFMFEPESLGFVYVNQGAVQSMGYSRDELLGMTPHQIKPFIPEARFRQIIAPLISGEQSSLRFDTMHRRKDGTDFPVGVFLQLVRQEDGHSLFVAIVQDITERKQAQDDILRINASLEERVQRRTGQLEASNRELKEFAHSVAHDLRQPFIAIGGFSGLLERTVTDERARHYIARINAGVQRANELTDALLALANLSSVQLHLQAVDISAIAHSVMDALRYEAPERRASVSIQAGLSVQADPALIRQVMQQLLGNAWKFTSRQSHTRISFGLLPAQADALDAAPVYVVRDNGEGFDMAHVDKLFLNFQRLQTAQDLPGMGIGLANVQRIVMRHKGRVWAESALGEGASFYFTVGNA